MRKEMVRNLEYIITCADRAIQQEKGQMERLGKWYIKQELDEIDRAVRNVRVIHNDRQHSMNFEKEQP